MNYIKALLDLICKSYGLTTETADIIIFGVGQNGKSLLERFNRSGIDILCFCDNNSEHYSKEIMGKRCIPFDELCEFHKHSIIFVSPIDSNSIRIQLNENGFENVVDENINKILNVLPSISDKSAFSNFFNIGHFYSLYPDLDVIMNRSEDLFSKDKIIYDVELNEETQIEILKQMTKLYDTLPAWSDISVSKGKTEFRHHLVNPSLSHADAVGLHCMLRILKPKKMIEVGSGFTSAVTLDTNEFYLDNKMNIMFIEPYPNLLKSLLKETDDVEVIESGLEDIPLDVFERLNEGDVLFIDSTHVSKIGSDVNYLFFEIMPRLKKGTYIHLHDIFYPFEYPIKWIYDGMIWNELYLLRAFLQNNADYEIVFFQNMMEQKHKELFLHKWPFDQEICGGSIWLKKIN